MTEDIETGAEVRRLAEGLLGGEQAALRERRVIERIVRRVQITDVNDDIEERLTMGQRLADRVASIGGSWHFIVGFGLFLLAWAGVNALVLVEHAFDPYPFVFLNLILSMVAALQAPIIMMSQNRQAARDRAAAENDYEVNLQSATYLLALHEKVDRTQKSLDALLARQEAMDLRPAPVDQAPEAA